MRRAARIHVGARRTFNRVLRYVTFEREKERNTRQNWIPRNPKDREREREKKEKNLPLVFLFQTQRTKYEESYLDANG